MTLQLRAHRSLQFVRQRLVFHPLNRQFLDRHNDADITNYWANWDQCNLASILAIGVLCDREDLYNDAINYYKNGAGNGAASQAVRYIHPGYLGQWQESSRDQDHCTLGIGLAGVFCEMAWNQGDDMYGHDNRRFLAGAEYVAKCDLTDTRSATRTCRRCRSTRTPTSTAPPGAFPAPARRPCARYGK